MHLTHLILRNFRNYKEAHFTFSPFINLIEGGNGQGKTNLLEAIHFVSTGRSFRTPTFSDLIHFGETFFYIEAHFVKEGVSQQLKIYFDEKTRKVQYNQTVYTTFTSVLGILPSVLLSPEDHSLVVGAPEKRRRFLDLYIAQTDPLYVHHLGRYYKAIKQRNHLLRRKSESAIEPWEQMMAASAVYLIAKRKEAVMGLKDPSNKWMGRLTQEKEEFNVHYHSSLHDDDPLSQWKKHRAKELIVGSTLIGPHRDDLTFFLGEKQAKLYSSEGQKRTCVSSLRFAEWERLKSSSGHPPLLGIDDFGIQLDKDRRSQMKMHFKEFSQVFLTSPLPLETGIIEGDCRTFHIEKGLIKP